jgi:hypothetical protein
MHRGASLLMALCVLPILALTGQEPASVPAAARVRLKTDAADSSPPLVGTLVSIDGDSLVLVVAGRAAPVTVSRLASRWGGPLIRVLVTGMGSSGISAVFQGNAREGRALGDSPAGRTRNRGGLWTLPHILNTWSANGGGPHGPLAPHHAPLSFVDVPRLGGAECCS